MKKNVIFLILLIVSVLMVFASCGSNDETAATNAPQASTPTAAATKDPSSEATPTPAAGKYKVTVVDNNGQPISGALIQLCLDETCNPARTDKDGVAYFNVADANYKVSFLTLPEGYSYTGEDTNFYFEAGSYELTITLNKVAE